MGTAEGYSAGYGTAASVVVAAAALIEYHIPTALPYIAYAAFGAGLNNNIKILLVIDKRLNILYLHQFF